VKYDDAENDDVEEEEDDTEDADAEERSQDRAACFVQACAVCVEIYRKVPESRTKVRACAVGMHFNMSQVPLHTEIS